MNTTKKLIAAGAVMLATAGVAAPVGIMTANAASAPVLKEGTKSQHVKSLQLLLRAHGANIAVDGSFGPATTKAVKDFQRSKGLQADGVVGPKTLAKLGPTLKYGANGEAVKALQQILRNNGATVAVDGNFGPKTRAAVISFQRSKKIATDGVVGPNTWQAMFGSTGGSTPTPPPVNPGKPHPGDITRADLEKMFPGHVADTRRVDQGLARLNQEMRDSKINTAARKAAFLATIAHESTFDYAIGERGYPSYTYRGRGYIQITGDFNYRSAGKAIGVDLMGKNQVRASELNNSANIAGWYWTVGGGPESGNTAADRFDMGRVSGIIRYDNRNNNEDNERCASFKRAYKYLSGQNAPASTRCARH